MSLASADSERELGPSAVRAERRLQTIAASLARAEATQTPITPLSESFPGLSLEEAYAAQVINVRAREAAGARVIGHKVGLTAAPMQRMLGVDEPDFGHLYDDRLSLSGAWIHTGGLIAPRIEPEIAFILGQRLVGPGVTVADVLAATVYVVPALEVIDSRIADWRITLVDTVADNASGSSVVLGGRKTCPYEFDLAAAGVTLSVDGSVERGLGAAVLGHPAAAVAWLANTLGRYGMHLARGHLILPGSMTAAAPLVPGCSVVADFGELGSVEASAR